MRPPLNGSQACFFSVVSQPGTTPLSNPQAASLKYSLYITKRVPQFCAFEVAHTRDMWHSPQHEWVGSLGQGMGWLEIRGS
jgi:hypothetical protein